MTSLLIFKFSMSLAGTIFSKRVEKVHILEIGS